MFLKVILSALLLVAPYGANAGSIRLTDAPLEILDLIMQKSEAQDVARFRQSCQTTSKLQYHPDHFRKSVNSYLNESSFGYKELQEMEAVAAGCKRILNLEPLLNLYENVSESENYLGSQLSMFLADSIIKRPALIGERNTVLANLLDALISDREEEKAHDLINAVAEMKFKFNGSTPLSQAIKYSSAQPVSSILNFYEASSISTFNDDIITALVDRMDADQKYSGDEAFEIFNLLTASNLALNFGANENMLFKGACKFDNLPIAQALIQLESVDALDGIFGNLIVAMKNGNAEIVKLLAQLIKERGSEIVQDMTLAEALTEALTLPLKCSVHRVILSSDVLFDQIQGTEVGLIAFKNALQAFDCKVEIFAYLKWIRVDDSAVKQVMSFGRLDVFPQVWENAVTSLDSDSIDAVVKFAVLNCKDDFLSVIFGSPRTPNPERLFLEVALPSMYRQVGSTFDAIMTQFSGHFKRSSLLSRIIQALESDPQLKKFTTLKKHIQSTYNKESRNLPITTKRRSSESESIISGLTKRIANLSPQSILEGLLFINPQDGFRAQDEDPMDEDEF